jgi:glucan 1,3-beta-glucosidase
VPVQCLLLTLQPNAGVNDFVSGTAVVSLVLDNFAVSGATAAVKSSNGSTWPVQYLLVRPGSWVTSERSFPRLKSVFFRAVILTLVRGVEGYQPGKIYPISRPAALQVSGRYFTMPLPQYELYDMSQVVSVKGDLQYPVYGDSEFTGLVVRYRQMLTRTLDLHDDGPAINAILSKYAGCKLVFFPQCIYLTRETIYVPSGSRLVVRP